MLSCFSSTSRGENAEALLIELFEAHGWDVDRSPARTSPDLVIRRGAQCLVVEIKSLAEGRPDRVIPMLSQAILQA